MCVPVLMCLLIRITRQKGQPLAKLLLPIRLKVSLFRCWNRLTVAEALLSSATSDEQHHLGDLECCHFTFHKHTKCKKRKMLVFKLLVVLVVLQWWASKLTSVRSSNPGDWPTNRLQCVKIYDRLTVPVPFDWLYTHSQHTGSKWTASEAWWMKERAKIGPLNWSEKN